MSDRNLHPVMRQVFAPHMPEASDTISEALRAYGVEHERYDGHNERHYIRFRGEPMGLMSAHEAMMLVVLLRYVGEGPKAAEEFLNEVRGAINE